VSGNAGPAEIFAASLRLGTTSFGGPIAHLGYMQRAYVEERGWVTPAQYASVVGLCQILPGPSSSQVGFLVGYARAGWKGALAAWAGFTLPSACLMFAFALLATRVHGGLPLAATHGLMLAAAAIVAQAVWNMARNACPDVRRAAIAVATACVVLLTGGGTAAQLSMMLAGAVGGWLMIPQSSLPAQVPSVERQAGRAGPWVILGAVCALLALLPVMAAFDPHGIAAIANIFYRAGALVFGGGHVVLPLLRASLVPAGFVSDPVFLTGYGFAQALPGPLFTLAAYLGAASAPKHFAALWAAVALVSIFLPGLLLAVAGTQLFGILTAASRAPALIAGINAAVVGLLAAALWNPICITSIGTPIDAAIAIVGFALLVAGRAPPIAVVGLCTLASLVIAAAGGAAQVV
jgi:chromate transporter